jgi:hypothetical protein
MNYLINYFWFDWLVGWVSVVSGCVRIVGLCRQIVDLAVWISTDLYCSVLYCSVGVSRCVEIRRVFTQVSLCVTRCDWV